LAADAVNALEDIKEEIMKMSQMLKLKDELKS